MVLKTIWCKKSFFWEFINTLVFLNSINLTFNSYFPLKLILIKTISCLTALLFTALVNSQEFALSGKVTHPFEKELENIHIFNTTSSKGTLTDLFGDFKMMVSIGDTLHISSLQFKSEIITISLEEFVSKELIIELDHFTNELDEVVIKNHHLTGDLNRDSKNIQTKPVVSALSLGIIDKEIRVLTQSERRLKTASYGAGPMSLDGIINGISGRTKMLKNRVKLEKDNQRIERILEVFPEKYLIEELMIDKSKVYEFLYYCEAHSEFREITQKDAISILHFLRQQAESYLKLKKEAK